MRSKALQIIIFFEIGLNRNFSGKAYVKDKWKDVICVAPSHAQLGPCASHATEESVQNRNYEKSVQMGSFTKVVSEASERRHNHKQYTQMYPRSSFPIFE